ncbi:putative glycerophosphoryl diester phosphodiesterase 2 [Platanthera zijinensis]|uniref:glycerophosphodiester phosphodiesterase n=1 Tax=Platanthera zijinensis TaxID=2320716 RepID=A0AAP0GA65_9ASPA
MMNLRRILPSLFPLLFIIHGAVAQPATISAAGGASPPPKWQTLSGSPPSVVARGGFSGVFPESSQYAYQFAVSPGSVRDVVLFCDLQLTKDSIGICKTDIRLDNSTSIATVYPKRANTYQVNGQEVRGWFSIDFTAEELFNNVTLIQNIFSRPSAFDGSMPMSTIDDVQGLKPPGIWLNVQYNAFYREHKLDALDFIDLATQDIRFNFISSPEIGFLKGVDVKNMKTKPKLVFRILDSETIEPTTNKTYGVLVKDLANIKTFASGILVPKEYIWPIGDNGYLEPATNLVTDAHGLGLEVYASGFANDMPGSYNNSYDPVNEYLQFIDNSKFSVDGVLTDFPSTASEAIACFAHNSQNNTPSGVGHPLVITHNGASGIYPGCTDLAYKQAAEDGADIIDCSVQMSKDGVAFCLDSADLSGSTTAMPTFMSRSTTVPEIQNKTGIFTFDLTWSEIQSLKPNLFSPYASFGLLRNPAAKNLGNILALPEFLTFAKNSTVQGVLINIQNAAYLASKKGFDVVDAVSTALANASYSNDTTRRVLIQSDDTSVLSAFKKNPNYERVLLILEQVGDTPKSTVEEIKQFADAVNVIRSSLMAFNGAFISSYTDVVTEMQNSNVSVYVSVLRNEFTTIAYDFFSDPVVEIATLVNGLGVDGLITEFPATARAYLRTPCSNLDAKLPYTILPAEAGGIAGLAAPEALPPAQSPAPTLEPADVVDPPLPAVSNNANPAPAQTPGAEPKDSGQLSNAAVSPSLCLLVVMLSYMYLRHH